MYKGISFIIIYVAIVSSNVFSQDILIYTLGDNVNIRSNPSITATVVAKVENYTDFIVIEKGVKEKINGNSDFWYNVKNNEVEGWVFGHFTSLRQAGRKTLVLKYTKYDHWDYDYPAMYTFEDKSGKKYELSSWAMPTMSFKLSLENEEIHDGANPELLGKDFNLTINYLPYKFEDPSDESTGIYEHWVCIEISEVK
jgi:hypothetical protein